MKTYIVHVTRRYEIAAKSEEEARSYAVEDDGTCFDSQVETLTVDGADPNGSPDDREIPPDEAGPPGGEWTFNG